MGGVFPSETNIYIEVVDTLASSLDTTGTPIKGEITNVNLKGGEQDIETVHAIGGDIDKELPRTQFELTFDVIVNNTDATTLDRWDTYKYGSGLTSATEGDYKAIFLEFVTGSSKKIVAMNNCRAVTWEPEMSADDMLKGSITFKFSPLTSDDKANYKTETVASGGSYSIDWS